MTQYVPLIRSHILSWHPQLFPSCTHKELPCFLHSWDNSSHLSLNHLFEHILMIQGIIKSWRPLVSFNFVSYRKHDIQYKGENYVEICDHVSTNFNKIRSFCSFAIFHIAISVLEIFSLIYLICFSTREFNCNDTKQKQPQPPKKVKSLHSPNYKPCFSPRLYFWFARII